MIYDELNEREQGEFDSWTKEDVYAAYLMEYYARVRLNNELNAERLKIVKIKYDLNQALKGI